VVTVQGPIAALLELGEIHIDRNTQYGSGPRTVLDGSTSFFFSFSLDFLDTRLAQVRRICPSSPARSTTPRHRFPSRRSCACSPGTRRCFSPNQADDLDDRLRRALTHLSEKGLARAIMAGPERTGWVWNDVPLTDAEWKKRAERQPIDGYRLPILRAVPPEASVVVIGAAGSGSVR
jgi:hypothetical protein